ncbi:MAG: sialate O-acetylesterase, partial [Kiritimatiellales bacterium]
AGDYVAMDNIRTASLWDDIAVPASIPLSVHPLFQHHMVLQRDMNVPIWGSVTPAASVMVSLDDTVVGTATADGRGKWQAKLLSHAYDGGIPHTLTISAEAQDSIYITNVVYGEVFLASGQSNMERDMNSIDPPGLAEEKTEAADYSLLRQVAMLRASSTNALEEPVIRWTGGWVPCSTSSVGGFSSTAYFFAKNIYLKTGMPVGLIVSAYGGQKIERFLCPEGVAAIPELSGLCQNQEQGGILNLYDLYNAMIHPLIPYGIRGVIWYQGEANTVEDEGDLYRLKMQALIRGWRSKWGQGDFPFYYVQLANFSTDNSWRGLQEAQLHALSETNTGIAVAVDIGEDDNIHPHDKQDVGHRLAQWMLTRDLGYDLPFSGPLVHQAVVEGSQIRILFDYADNGLLVGQKNSTNSLISVTEPLQNFEIAGSDRVFVDATASIDRDSIVVSNSTVNAPVYVRYCYANAPAGSNKLYNAAGLPASPFRTDRSYRLDVKSGSGTAANVLSGTEASITASTAPSGEVFDRWIGAAAELADLNSAATTVTMPSNALYLLATYRSTDETAYTLTVNNGYGSGTSQSNSILNIQAAAPADGQVFDHWIGDTQTVENVQASSITLRMPAHDVAVTAVYRTIDTVGDGVPDTWRSSYFGGSGSTTNSDSAADADPDGDGVVNRDEYLAGTSPVDADSVFKLNNALSGDEIALRFRALKGLRYRLETTDSLTAPSWETILFNITGDGAEKSFMLPTAETNGFYRVRTE